MESANVRILPLFMTFLVLVSYMECQPVPRPPHTPHPLCISQFVLVDNACSRLPIHPLPPSPPPPPPAADVVDNDDNERMMRHENGNGHRHGHGHGHGHSHGHRHRHQETPAEQDCCRWLKEVDTECVCDLLVRLPVFLSKPVHEYTVMVDESCNVTYSCGGRLRV